MNKIFLFLFLSFLSFSSRCQLIDILQVHAGLSVFPSDEKKNAYEVPENIYGGFGSGQNLGIGIYKFITDKIQVGVVFDYVRASKPHFAIGIPKVHAIFKYNFIPPDVYRVSPYVFVGGGIAFVSLSQSSFSESDPVNDVPLINQIKFDTITNRGPSYNYFSPALSGVVGLGADVNVFYNYNIFIEGSYNSILAKNMTTNSIIQNPYLSSNQSNISYFTVIAGLRIYMY